jgi:hypothetical protein
MTPITTALRALDPLVFHQVRRTPDEGLFNSLLAQYHYLGYQQPVGEHLKYLIVAGDRPVACFAWGSAPGALGIRDRFLGWSPTARQRHLRLLASNTRFLILPWVQVPHLASHLLGRMAARIPDRPPPPMAPRGPRRVPPHAPRDGTDTAETAPRPTRARCGSGSLMRSCITAMGAPAA